jgi:hypothetical protein
MTFNRQVASLSSTFDAAFRHNSGVNSPLSRAAVPAAVNA